VTSQSAEDIAIPDDLADTIRWAAAGVPGAPPELTEIRRRHRHRRLGRSTAALAGVGVIVAASIVAPRLLTGFATPVESAAPAEPTLTPAPPPPPAERLFVVNGGGFIIVPAGSGADENANAPDPSLPNFGYPPGAFGVVGSLLEVTESGEIVPLEPPQVEPGRVLSDSLFLSDGRIATLEFHSLSDEPRRDGPCITDAAIYLRVAAADGSVSTSGDVHVPCESIRLVGASADEVFLVRTPYDPVYQTVIPGRRLVAYRLSDGTERTVADLDGVGEQIVATSTGAASFVVRDNSTTTCQVQVVDVTSGSVRDVDLAVVLPDCYVVDTARISPDGALLAVSFITDEVATQHYQVGFAVVDTTGPSLRLHQSIAAGAAVDSPPRCPAATLAGIAWADDVAVRVAWARCPANLDRVIDIKEILDVQTYPLP
jgi:hypothetical protein